MEMSTEHTNPIGSPIFSGQLHRALQAQPHVVSAGGIMNAIYFACHLHYPGPITPE